MRRILIPTLLILALVGCGTPAPPLLTGTLSPVVTPTSEMVPTSTVLPPATLTSTATPVPTATLVPTTTIAPTTVFKNSEGAMRVYTTLVLLKTNQVLLEETAIAVRDQKIDGIKGLGALIAIAGIISATQQALSEPASVDDLSTAWEQGKIANENMRILVIRWLEKSITSSDVLQELPAISKQIDVAIGATQDILAKRYNADAGKLKQEYDQAVEDARQRLKTLISK